MELTKIRKTKTIIADCHLRQAEAVKYWYDDSTEEILFGGAKEGGKSYLGASLIFSDALTYPDTAYFIARKDLNDLRKFTIPTINELFYNWKLPIEKYAKYNGQDNYYQLYNTSRVYFLDCKEMPSDPMYERFGSMQMTKGWEEEAGEIPFMAHQNLRLSLGRKNNDKYRLKKKLLITCNPKKNWLYQDFYIPARDGTLPPEKKFIKSLITDNIYRGEDGIRTLDSIKDKTTRMRLRHGDWEYDDDPAVMIEYSKILDLWTNDHVEKGEKIISADVALQGSDKFVIGDWDGLILKDIQAFAKSTGQDVEFAIKKKKRESKVPMSNIVYDHDGVGGFLSGYLEGAYGFINNSKALKDENYANFKSQCAFYLADMINNGEIWVKTEKYKEEIIEELSQLRRKDIDKDGKLAIEPKDKVKERLGRSPDFLDMMIMRMVYFLKRKPADYIDLSGSANDPDDFLFR